MDENRHCRGPQCRKNMTGEAKRVKMDGGFELDVSRDTSGKIFSRDSTILDPLPPVQQDRLQNEISRNANIKPSFYNKDTSMLTNADPPPRPGDRKNMTGEAKRVKMDGRCEEV